MLYLLYSTLGYALYAFLVLLLPVAGIFGRRYAYGLGQRLGRYDQEIKPDGSRPLLWIHASSVGEVQAALILINALLGADKSVQLVLSSTTEQGQKMAAARLGANIPCVLAPLDFPPAVRRTLYFFRPTLYIGLETELWPVMLTALGRTNVPKLLLNGRISERSVKRYRHLFDFFAPLIRGFQTLCVIGSDDRTRFLALGAQADKVEVCGNLKYDMPAEQGEAKRRQLRRRLGVTGDQSVFLCGSTHEGEEALLAPLVQTLQEQWPLIWVVAPRHLERIPAVITLLQQRGFAYHLYSELSQTIRSHEVVLVDTIGDLADLYCAADFIFCGGSLVDRGGHNIMEAARWGRPVYYGPHVKDHKDAATLLRDSGGGFQVADIQALLTLMRDHHSHPEAYMLACQRAAETAASQRGAVARQMAIVLQALESRPDDHAERG